MSNNLQTFFENVGKSKLLTREEEVMLSQRIEKGDEEARKRMIRSNIRLAISIAKKYQNKGCELEDLIQESSIGLMKAVDRFDWRRGFKFSTYACWWIKQAVRRHVASHSSSVRLPSYAKGLMWKIGNCRKEYEEEFGSRPTDEEVADLLGISLSSLKAVTTCSMTPISLDSTTKYRGSSGPSEGRTLAESIKDERAPSPDELIDREKIVNKIKEVLSSLSDREEKIIRLRFGISEDPVDHVNFPITSDQIDELNARCGGK